MLRLRCEKIYEKQMKNSNNNNNNTNNNNNNNNIKHG